MKILICCLLITGLLIGTSANVGEVLVDNKQNIEIKYVDGVENMDKTAYVEVDGDDYFGIALSVLNTIGIVDNCIKGVTVEKSIVIVDFILDSCVLHSGTAGELAILDSLAMTFVESLGFENIIFRVDGKPYESGHIAFGLNEKYY